MEIIKILKEFEGIIGALLGVLLTLITTKCLESWGELKYYVNNVRVKYLKRDSLGQYVETESINEVEIIQCYFKIGIYNSSNIIKPLKEIKAVIKTENNTIETILSDSDTNRGSHGRILYDKVLFSNFNPKEIKEYNLSFALNDLNFVEGQIEEIKKIDFVAKDINNKQVIKNIYSNKGNSE